MIRDTGITDAFIELAKSLRQKKNLTIEQLADLAGVHRTTIGLLERKERSPTLQVASQIASALNVPFSELIHESELINKGKAITPNITAYHKRRTPNMEDIRNENKLMEYIGIDAAALIGAIDSCYLTLDVIDDQLLGKGSLPIAHLIELTNLSSMVGNLLATGIADGSNGLYSRNKPHAYPDLLPLKDPAVELEIKIALETNKPKGHLPKAGAYLIFRYILGDRHGNFKRGKDNRGDTVWIWEAKVGYLEKKDFSFSNTVRDSGKTATIKTDTHNRMYLVYYVQEHLPYAQRSNGTYVGFN